MLYIYIIIVYIYIYIILLLFHCINILFNIIVIISFLLPKWWNLVDTLGLGSNFERIRGSNPLFGIYKILFKCVAQW